MAEDANVMDDDFKKGLKESLIKAAVGLNQEEKAILVDRLEIIKDLWDPKEPNLTNAKGSYLSKPKEQRSNKVEEVFKEIAKDLFVYSTPEKQTTAMSAIAKINPELASELAAAKILAESIDSLEHKTGQKVTPERREKLSKALLPALKSLGHEYLTLKTGNITMELTESLSAKKTFFPVSLKTIELALKI